MALENSTSNGKKINLKLVSVVWPVENKSDAPKFVVLDLDYKETWVSYNKIKWTLTNLYGSFTPKKWKMWDIYWFKAYLKDWDEFYVIESTITNASKDLLNWLLTSKDKEIEISLYLNKNNYPASSVRENWEFVKWKYEFKELENVKLFNSILEAFPEELKASDLPF